MLSQNSITIKDLLGTKKPLIMGILNITPDSFSDGGKYFQISDAVQHARELINSGVDIIDIGGESTRPGAVPVSEEEELKRVIPVIERLKGVIARSVSDEAILHNQYRLCEIASPLARNDNIDSNVFISIDTYKSNVADLALKAGARMVNDVSGLTIDSDMVKVARDANCSIVIMHNNGIPATKPTTHSNDILQEVYSWLKKQTDFAIKNGIKKENIIIDPGIGFGKTPKENLSLIENLQELKPLGFPILVGPSRKSFIRELFPGCDIEVKIKEMTELVIKNGVDIVRVHEVMIQP